jgi:hypothetical protein
MKHGHSKQRRKPESEGSLNVEGEHYGWSQTGAVPVLGDAVRGRLHYEELL